MEMDSSKLWKERPQETGGGRTWESLGAIAAALGLPETPSADFDRSHLGGALINGDNR